MAVRNIVKLPSETLRRICRTQLNFDDRLHTMLDDMAETMHKADGVGLAAPQVGILRRVCVVDIGDGVIELVNPVIVKESGKQTDSEGCLSIPGRYEMVIRAMNIIVKAQDRFGNNFELSAEGLKARAISHEVDHLNGILFIDKI